LLQRDCPTGICLHYGREPDGKARLLQGSIDAQVIQAEHTCTAYENVLYCLFRQNRALTRLTRPLNHTKTARIEFEQVCYLVVWF
jgi:hypothetical protein